MATDAQVAATKQQGVDSRGVAQTARAAWRKAIASFELAGRLGSARGRAHAALGLFGAYGRLKALIRAVRRGRALDVTERAPYDRVAAVQRARSWPAARWTA